jgi:uncharacterized membrane protein YtjA (UPF0391 family)
MPRTIVGRTIVARQVREHLEVGGIADLCVPQL